MDTQIDEASSRENRFKQLEEENNFLKEEITSIRSYYEDALARLRKEVEAEKALEESHIRFKTIFEQSKLGSKIIAPDLRIIQVNKALQVMLGYSEQELIGTKITAYAHPDFKTPWHELQKHLWKGEISYFKLDTYLLKKDGSILWCGVTTILFSDKNAALGYTILEEITDRKVREDRLYQQASLVNRDLENFIYTASHDLKAPIVNMEGLLITLTKKLTHSFLLSDEQNMLLSLIAASIDRLKLTISDLAEIAKVQEEAVTEEFIEIDTILEEVLEDLHAYIASAQVNVRKRIQVDTIKFARKNMRCILHNLLSNAVKYHSPNRTPLVHIETHVQEPYLVIKVADNGMGMEENHLNKLFTLFKRFHTHVEGTGIGLYMVKKIVDNCNGKIKVESKVDTGTTFQVYLPFGQ